MAAGKEMFDGLKKLDPTRVYYSHAGACTGDVYTMNCYLDLIPLQEREDWLSEWAQSGEMPISMIEFGTPMDCTFRRGHDGFTSNITSEPLLTEFSAIYFGKDAYTAEEPKYRQYLHDLFRSGMLYDSSENRLDDYANMHKIQQLFRTNTWRSWRTAGLPGGLRTWSWIQDTLKENNGPTLAWIAGPAGAYTAKDHHFRSGQKIEKQIVLINDTRRPQPFTATWTATVGGKEVGRGKMDGNLAVSETRFLPIQFSAPSEEAGAKTDGRITLTATIGETKHQDSFAFRVFGEDRPGQGEIAVVDPDGSATKMLANLGYTTHAWKGTAEPLVIIGRNALKEDPHGDQAGGLRARRRTGADLCAGPGLDGAGPRLAGVPTRHPACLPHEFLGYPRPGCRRPARLDGKQHLDRGLPEIPGKLPQGKRRRSALRRLALGQRGAVSSAAIEKPHRSGWRPLLECEFDLAYTPLMELDFGQGRLIVCTLDLEDHVASDPAARRLAGRIIDYALHARCLHGQARSSISAAKRARPGWTGSA